MFVVTVTEYDTVIECSVFRDEQLAEQKFLDYCSDWVSNWGDYTVDEIQECIDDQYCKRGRGAIQITEVLDYDLD